MKSIITVLLLLCLPAYARDPDWNPFIGDIMKDIYRNIDYGFSVGIPESLTGYGANSPNPNHGVAIKLGEHRPISIFSEYNSIEFPSTHAAMNWALQTDHARHVSRTNIHLDGHPAERAEYKEDGHYIVHIVRLRPYEPHNAIEEQLYMETDKAHYDEDVKTFDWVAASFHEIPIAP